jgi:hypothetical protein
MFETVERKKRLWPQLAWTKQGGIHLLSAQSIEDTDVESIIPRIVEKWYHSSRGTVGHTPAVSKMQPVQCMETEIHSKKLCDKTKYSGMAGMLFR